MARRSHSTQGEMMCGTPQHGPRGNPESRAIHNHFQRRAFGNLGTFDRPPRFRPSGWSSTRKKREAAGGNGQCCAYLASSSVPTHYLVEANILAKNSTKMRPAM